MVGGTSNALRHRGSGIGGQKSLRRPEPAFEKSMGWPPNIACEGSQPEPVFKVLLRPHDLVLRIVCSCFFMCLLAYIGAKTVAALAFIHIVCMLISGFFYYQGSTFKSSIVLCTSAGVLGLACVALTGGLSSPFVFILTVTPSMTIYSIGPRVGMTVGMTFLPCLIALAFVPSGWNELEACLINYDVNDTQRILRWIYTIMWVSCGLQHFALVLALMLNLRDGFDTALRVKLEAQALADSNKFRRDFVASMSHEFRTPMNAICGACESLLVDCATDNRDTGWISLIDSSARTLLALVNDMLCVVATHPCGGPGKRGIQLQSVPCDFLNLLGEVLRTATPKPGVEILPLAVDQSAQQVCNTQYQRLLSDPDRFRQIVSHLVSNAVKFTEAGEVRVTVSAKAAPSPEGSLPRMMLVVSIKDTGIGIAQEHLEQIFEPFAQGDSTATRRYGGTGVGLTISRNLAEIMKGSITVTSQLGKGSEFVFSCPASVVQTPMPAPTSHSPSERSSNYHTRLSISSVSSVGSRPLVTCSPILEISSKLVSGTLSTDKLGRYERGSFSSGLVGPLDGSTPVWSRVTSPLDPTETPPTTLSRITPLFHATPLPDGPVPPLSRKNSPTSSEFDSHSPKPKREAAYTGQTCIVVDDNKVNLKILCNQLHRLGFSIETAANGKEAVETAIQHGARAFCIFMDIMMPEMDGVQASKEIRQKGTQPGFEYLATLPIFACTTSDNREEFLQAGMNGCVLKPVTAADLQELFRVAIR